MSTCHKRRPMKSGFKINPAQRKELIELYLAGGQKAVLEKQKEYGVCDKYAANLACVMGLHRADTDYKDPRWKWAIERGPVLA